MKIGILTFHRAINFGAILQMYALNNLIKTYGNEVEIINYYNLPMREDFKLLKKISLRSLFFFIILLPRNIISRLKFKKFNKRYFKLSGKLLSNSTELEEIANKYGKIVTGSDQVFNYIITYGDYNYFLEFCHDKEKKIAYAPSFGFTDLNVEGEQKKIGKLLLDFKFLSIREKQGQEIIRKLTNKSVPIVLDPTYLLDDKEWLKIARKVSIKGDYLLVYSFGSDSLDEFVKTFSQKWGLKVVWINGPLKKIFYNNQIPVGSIGPQEFIWLFANAKYIATNSFHGTAFSIIFKKNFYLEMLKDNLGSRNSRFLTIIEELSLEDRLIDSAEIQEIQNIDYDRVYIKLNHWKKESIDYLLNAIK